jgi:pimeloyl-ACP methyl ester carboxylesterase
MLGARLDWALTRISQRRKRSDSTKMLGMLIDTRMGKIRVYDPAPQSTKPCVVFVPDGPNVVEHYEALIQLLSPSLRVICFDMPGFGHSLPQVTTTHRLDEGARAIFAVMDALGVTNATLALSCANGLYAIRAAQLAPARVTQLVLAQTPSMGAMQSWVSRIIPLPLRIPIVGQMVTWLFRSKIENPWYRIALPRTTDAKPFQEITRSATARGSCYCLSGVVQGLMSEKSELLAPDSVPCTMIWGALDRSHKPTLPQSLLAHAPSAEIVQFEDCGHFPELEQPERYAQLLMRLVSGF